MTSQEAEVVEAACHLARRLPADALERLCRAVEKLTSAPSAAQATHVSAVLVGEDARTDAAKTLEVWRKHAPYLSSQTMAWMMRGAVAADSWRERQQRVEAVWTGPATGDPSLRRTDAALIEVIDSAVDRLWIVTFAAYRVVPVMDALRRAVGRGVHVFFVGESSTENEALTSGGVTVLRDYLPSAVVVYIWPIEKRVLDDNGHAGTLHAKVAIADGAVALISSANLSGHALRLNIEAGTLIHGGCVPASLEAHLEGLASDGVLRVLP